MGNKTENESSGRNFPQGERLVKRR